jgi:hypothetical protein
MWRTAMALSIEAPDTPFSQRYCALDRMLTAQLCDMVAVLQRHGRLSAEPPARIVGALLFNNLNQMFIEFVKTEEMEMDNLRSAVRQQTGLVVGLLAS